MCENINECNTDNPTHNCNIEATCYDEIGYFACICNAGYHGDGFGENGCIDVDECSTGVHTCLTSEAEFQNKTIKLWCCDHNFTTKRNLFFKQASQSPQNFVKLWKMNSKWKKL